MLHVPLLRWGRPYRSIDVARAPHYRTREPVAEISQANLGLIRRDLLGQEAARHALAALPCEEGIAICGRAADLFLNAELPLGDTAQSPEDYVRQVSSTTGLPRVMARKNMHKIATVMRQMREVLNGLTRHLDLAVFDSGYSGALSYFPRALSLGVVLPSNSPGVHSLWIPSFAMKVPLVLKPGSGEPWSPYRIIQALVRAGAPAEVFGYYPADHAGGGEILRRCGRGMVFGDVSSTRLWHGDSRIEIHGPGYSKIYIGEDCIDDWERYLDVMVASILENSGRSCINCSGVWVPRRAAEIAAALAERLAQVKPRGEEDPGAQLAPFADAGVAARIADMSGAELAVWNGCAYVLPRIVLCDSPGDEWANREFLFPFASVVPVPQDEVPERLGPSLVVTAITKDRALMDRMLASPNVGRLNLGPIPTNQISWDQPHEGNLFDHLYARRAFQMAV
jgi:acyl-CoA reductase-like NAD-dependent aldehyde dehydrogenase